eukprot:g1933.t1
MAGGGAKKWSKGKVREKLNAMVMFDKKTHERLHAEIPKMKLISTATVAERLKCTGSLARAGIKELHEAGKIKLVCKHNSQIIYTGAKE